jgi:HK97 family phage major capsid protein
MKSKAMKNLLNALAKAKSEAEALTNKPDTPAAEMNAKLDEIKAIKAKIATQEVLDDGKNFDDNGEEIKDTMPVNKPVYAEPKDHTKKGPFNTFGEQLRAIANYRPGNSPDPRLIAIQNASGANEAIPSEGGFLVQQDFAAEILKDTYKTSVLAPLCRKVNISANSNGIKMNGVDESSRANGSRWGGVQAYWADEAATVTASKPKFRQINLSLNKVMALYYATDELLQDAAAMDSVMRQAFAEELGFKVDEAIFLGDGAGKPLGFMKSGSLVTVPKEAGQVADTIVHENISKMWARMFARARNSAVWLINQECEPQLEAMAIAIGTGGTLSPLAIEYMTKGTIKGRPVIPVEQASALGDLGDIVLADMGGYLLADKSSMQFAASMHVQFLYDEMAFRVTYRVDGQPARDKALTPYKGASTLSSFVTLAERA